MQGINCFLDFEFNTDNIKNSKDRELVSMAAFFMDDSYQIVKEFATVVKPSKHTKVSEQCIRFTGISRKQIEKSPGFDKVVEDFLKLTEQFKPDNYYVWGNSDRRVVEKSVRYAHANKKMLKIAASFIDYQAVVKEKFASKNVFNLERMADVCGIEFEHTFSAKSDAWCLSQIYAAVNQQKFDLEKYHQYEMFYSIKRFLGEYVVKKESLEAKKKHVKKMKECMKKMDCRKKEYLLTKELLVSEKERIQQLQEFFEQNEGNYEKASEKLKELEENLKLT